MIKWDGYFWMRKLNNLNIVFFLIDCENKLVFIIMKKIYYFSGI